MSDKEENEDEGISDARVYSVLEGLVPSSEEKRKRREREEQQRQKEIEESVAEAEEQRKSELLEKVAEVVSDSEWFDRIRTFIRSAVANSETQIVQMLLVREKDDIWSFEAIIGMEKPKGVNYIKVDFGNEP